MLSESCFPVALRYLKSSIAISQIGMIMKAWTHGKEEKEEKWTLPRLMALEEDASATTILASKWVSAFQPVRVRGQSRTLFQHRRHVK